MSTQKVESDLTNIWLHLGASAFFRSHQAFYSNELHQQGDTSWQMHLANIRNSSSQETLKSLQKQNGQYTLEIVSPDGQTDYHPVHCIKKIILWDSQLQSVVESGAHPDTKIISFTVTESGYFLNEDGSLNTTHPAIQADLLGEDEVNTLYGALYLILDQRMTKNIGPVNLLCCDNLRDNGTSFYRGLKEFIQAKNNTKLLSWIEENTVAPNSMVDRITPKFDSSIHERMAQHQLPYDEVPLTCERYTRWVLENKFIAPHPHFEKVGVELVKDVAPYEEAKIRLLNASHSGISWYGALKNKIYIHESLDNDITSLLELYATENVDYALKNRNININAAVESKTILDRFQSPYVKDTVARVSSDSISKLRGFILPTVKDCLNHNKIPFPALKLLSLYYLFLEQHYHNTLDFEYVDSAISSLDLEKIFSAAHPIVEFANNAELWGSLIENETFTYELISAIEENKQKFR